MSVQGLTSSSTTFYGLLFCGWVSVNQDDLHCRIYYGSLDGSKLNSRISNWRETEKDAEPEAAVVDQPTRLNFSNLLVKYESSICSIHGGLILTHLETAQTYNIRDPSNKIKCITLPRSRFLGTNGRGYNLDKPAIVTAERNFNVIRIYSNDGRWAEVFSSDNFEWERYNVNNIEKRISRLDWHLTGAVFVDGTLYFLAGSEHKYVVGVNIPSTDNPEMNVVRSLDLPQPIPDGSDIKPALHVSDECLYISYAKAGYMGIWRLDRNTRRWISEFIFDIKSDNPPPKPIVEYLCKNSLEVVVPLNMHPEKPIVYLHRRPFIVAFNLSNGEVGDDIRLEGNAKVRPEDFHLFSPCSVALSDHINQKQPSSVKLAI